MRLSQTEKRRSHLRVDLSGVSVRYCATFERTSRGVTISLKDLFCELADVFSGPLPIERHARSELHGADSDHAFSQDAAPLPDSVLSAMALPDAHPICALISRLPFQWAPPQSSNDPLYAAHSVAKVHVELLGPGGLVKSDQVRLGLYGMMPHAEYGIRTHPAEEIYVMLAGEADWKRGAEPYTPHMPGERSYHPSMLPHASRTRDKAFMSVYAWHGDISTDNYVYKGLPEEP